MANNLEESLNVCWSAEKQHPHHRKQFNPYIRPYLCMLVTCILFRSLLFMEGESRDVYSDQIVTCHVGVLLHSKTHRYPLFMKYSNGTQGHSVIHTSI